MQRTSDLSARAAGAPLTVYRDPADVQVIRVLALLSGALLVAALLGAGWGVYMSHRRPNLVIVDRSEGRVVTVNDRQVPADTPAADLQGDQITDQDKRYLSKKWLEYFYTHDPASPGRYMAQAAAVMTAEGAQALSQFLRQNRVMDQRRQENWQANWKLQKLEVSKTDPYLLNVVGVQEIFRDQDGKRLREVKQLQGEIRLVAEPNAQGNGVARTDENLNTGLRVQSAGLEEISAGVSRS